MKQLLKRELNEFDNFLILILAQMYLTENHFQIEYFSES